MLNRIVVAAAFMAVGLFGTVVRADDTADIRAAGKAFTTALHDGDVVNAKRYAFTDDTSDKALDIMTELTKSRKILIEAAVEKFGDEGKNVVVGGANLDRTNAVRNDFETAKVDVHGDSATVTTKDGPDSKPAMFKKMSGTWKIDLTKLADFSSITKNGPMMHTVSDSFIVSAKEIKDGKYKTVQAAKSAVQQNMVAAVRKSAGAPANR